MRDNSVELKHTGTSQDEGGFQQQSEISKPEHHLLMMGQSYWENGHLRDDELRKRNQETIMFNVLMKYVNYIFDEFVSLHTKTINPFCLKFSNNVSLARSKFLITGKYTELPINSIKNLSTFII